MENVKCIHIGKKWTNLIEKLPVYYVKVGGIQIGKKWTKLTAKIPLHYVKSEEHTNW